MEEVKIWCWRNQRGVDLGHVAIEIGQYIYGFYHNDIEGYSPIDNKPGIMKKQTEKEVCKDYLMSFYDSGIEIEFTSLDIINNQWTINPTPTAYVYTIEINRQTYIDLKGGFNYGQSV